MFRRRRPVLRAAAVGGAAYYAGKKGQEAAQRESDQEARLEELEAQQYAGAVPPAPAPAASGVTDDTIAQLQKLAQLKEQGILTEEEFAAQKQKLLNS